MSDQGERTCPLCAEEMDLTDQQLKPCKCGYEICVWCWHQIMDMAQKDESEGRCPACRSLYDKEKIVATAENCGRLVAEINTERKMKSQKGKSNKSSDGRKQLSTVRVIQRKLVYVVGLPLNLADEDLLGCKEYFAQYGRVLKVSMSRTAAGVIQQFPNNTCSVYITYSKEEEAIRCIQSVHGYVLEGRSLKACFGTTKYCHAWLRNMPCNNLDCLYLHEIGLHEDSFSKDEIVSAYTRSRVQQITGATNTMQQRSGNMLPPPSDDSYINSGTSDGKTLIKTASNILASIDKDFPPPSNCGRSTALPAGTSWGVWGTSFQPPVTSAVSSNGHYKQNPDTVSGTLAVSSAVSSKTQISTVHNDMGKKLIMTEDDTVQAKGEIDKLDFFKQHVSMEPQSTASDYKVTVDRNPSKGGAPAEDDDVGVGMSAKIINSVDDIRQIYDSGLGIDHNVTINGKSLCSDISSLSIGRNPRDEQFGVDKHNEITQQYYTQPNGDLIPFTAGTAINDVQVSNEQHDWRLNSQTQIVPNGCSEVEYDLQSFNDQRLKDPEVVSRSSYIPNLGDSCHISNHSREHSLGYSKAYRETDFNGHPLFGQWNTHESSLPHSFGTAVVSNGYSENMKSSSNSLDRAIERPYSTSDDGKGRQMGRFQSNMAASFGNGATIDKGESSIISNILSMDFDVWDDPITSPQNLSQLFGESDKLHGSLKKSSSWKVQSSNQSRFSFAREGESISQELDSDPSFNVGPVAKNHSFTQDFENKVPCLNRLGNGNSFSSNDIAEYNNISGRLSVIPSDKLFVSRPPVLAPPGFSSPNRAPPPGFSSHERTGQTFEALSGGQFLNNSSWLRNSYQALPTVNNNSTGDIELIDPAIMAVGKGRLSGGLNIPCIDLRSSFSSQYGSFENEARRQMLIQRSVPQHQSFRYTDTRNGFSMSNDNGYSLHSRLMEQTHANNLSPFSQLSLQNSRNAQMSNSQWNGWSDLQGENNKINMTDLRNERLGYNQNFYNGYEDSNFCMPSSSSSSSDNNNNRTFGM